jgi:hypothetical protein
MRQFGMLRTRLIDISLALAIFLFAGVSPSWSAQNFYFRAPATPADAAAAISDLASRLIPV